MNNDSDKLKNENMDKNQRILKSNKFFPFNNECKMKINF